MSNYMQGNTPAFCTNCGNRIIPGDAFCRGCGAKVEATDERKIRYDMAISLFDSGNHKGALSIFKELGDYEDAQKKAKECEKKIENANKELIYAAACDVITGSYNDEMQLKRAIEALSTIPEYKDSAAKISELKDMLAKWQKAEEERIEKQKKEAYDTAALHIENKLYEEAIKLLNTIEGYPGVDELAKQCVEGIEAERCEKLYANAVEALTAENKTDQSLIWAIEAFKSLGRFKDAEDKIGEAEAALDEWYVAKKAADEAERKRIAAIKAKKKKKRRIIAACVCLFLAALGTGGGVFATTEHSIEYDFAGGTAGDGTASTYTFLTDDFTLVNPTKDGYTFLGWTGTDLDSPTLTVTIDKYNFKDLSYTANWQVNNYNVTLDNTVNLGDIIVTLDHNYVDSTPTFISLSNGEFLSYPEAPTRSGYAFSGWYIDSYCTVPYSFSGNLTENITLYANWVPMVSDYTSVEYVDIADYSYDNKFNFSDITSTTSSYAHYYYFTAYTTGSYTLYAYHTYGDFYVYAYNATSNYYIMSSVNLYGANTSTNMYFSANAGDVIYLCIYSYYGASSNGSGSFYVAGASYPTSTATAICSNTPDYVYSEGISTNMTVEYDASFTLPVPTRYGYAFTGWYYGETKVEDGIWNIPSDATLVADWLAGGNTVTLDPNGGTVSSSSLAVVFGSEFTLPTPEKTGYTFAGWYCGDVPYESGVWSGTEDVTLVAEWTANQYTVTLEDIEFLNNYITVTFDYNYSGSTPTTVELDNGDTLSYPSIPTRNGYVFAGWYTDSSCTTMYPFSGTITDDMTLYAKWIAHSGNGVIPTNGTEYQLYVPYSTYNYYAFVPLVSGTVYYNTTQYNTGYNVMLCDSSKNSLNTWADSLDGNAYLTAGTLYYIRYSSSNSSRYITITLSASSPTSSAVAVCYNIEGFVYEDGATSTFSVEYDRTYTLPVLTRYGYTFLGWYDENRELVEDGVWTTTSDVTLTPMWDVGTNLITLDPNGGTVSSTTVSVTFDEEYTLPSPERTGYSFVGWYDGSTPYESGVWSGTEDVTLVAEWAANSYTVTLEDVEVVISEITVTFDYNYSGSSPYSVTLENGDTLSYPTVPTRSGYLFGGWYTDSSCTNLFNFSGTITEDITLYAKWVYPSYSYTKMLTVGSNTGSTSFNSTIKYYPFVSLVDQTITIYTSHSSGDPKIYLYDADLYQLQVNDDGYSTYRDALITYTVTAGTLYYAGFGCYSNGTGYMYITGTYTPASTATASCSEIEGYIYSYGSTETITVTYGEEFTLPVLSRYGYAFLGWYDENDNLVESGLWNTDSGMTLTPKWEIIESTITLDANGGTASESSIVLDYGDTLTLPTPERTGYTFLGWYDGSTPYESGVWSGMNDVTLVAAWEAKDYTVTLKDVEAVYDHITVTFDYQYSGYSNYSVTLYDGDTLPRPTNPTRTEYVFTGWYADSACTERYDFAGTITDDMTLYAGWTDMSMSSVYSGIQIDPADYTSSSYSYNVSTSGTDANYIKHIYLVAEETGTHYIYYKNDYSYTHYSYYLRIYNLTTNTTIKSWSNISSTSYSSKSFTCSKGDVIVISLYGYSSSYSTYAHFYFSEFGSYVSTATASCPDVVGYVYSEGSSGNMPVEYDGEFALPTPTRTGYTFLGWYDENGNELESGTWSIDDDVTLTPEWGV